MGRVATISELQGWQNTKLQIAHEHWPMMIVSAVRVERSQFPTQFGDFVHIQVSHF
jgi:hypothetical protein